MLSLQSFNEQAKEIRLKDICEKIITDNKATIIRGKKNLSKFLVTKNATEIR